MKYDSVADDWITSGLAVAMQLGCIAVSRQLQRDSRRCTHSEELYTIGSINERNLGAQQTHHGHQVNAEKKKWNLTTKTSLEKAIKKFNDSLSSTWLARKRFTRSLFFFVVCPFHQRVDCVAVFQWNIYNWKFLKFFFLFFTLSLTHRAINVEPMPAVVRKPHKLSTVGTSIHVDVALWHIQFSPFFLLLIGWCLFVRRFAISIGAFRFNLRRLKYH